MTNDGHYIKMVKNNQKHLHLLVKFSILGTVINQNYIHVEVKTRINLANSIEFIHAHIHTQKHKYTRTHTHTHSIDLSVCHMVCEYETSRNAVKT